MYTSVDLEEKRQEPTKATQVVCSQISDIMWMIKDCIKDPMKQETYILKFINTIGRYKDMNKLAEKLLDIEKKYKMSQLKKEDKEQEEDSMKEESITVVFEDMGSEKEEDEE